MTSSTHRPPLARPSWRRARGQGVSQRVLVACGPFGARLSAAAAASAIARGLEDGGLREPDLCPLALACDPDLDVQALLAELDFDARMRASRAVVIGTWRLQERALAGSATFELATRARQGGVPAYAVAGENALEAFDARILDLQLILQATSRGALQRAGRTLAGLV